MMTTLREKKRKSKRIRKKKKIKRLSPSEAVVPMVSRGPVAAD